MNTIIDLLVKVENKVSNIDLLKSKIVLTKNKRCNIHKFVRIYEGDKIKRPITINLEVEKLIEDFMYRNYGIKDNGSLAVNSALLLALHSNDNDVKVELEVPDPLDDLSNDGR